MNLPVPNRSDAARRALLAAALLGLALIGLGIWVQRWEEAEQAERAARLDARARWMLPFLTMLSLGISTLLLWR